MLALFYKPKGAEMQERKRDLNKKIVLDSPTAVILQLALNEAIKYTNNNTNRLKDPDKIKDNEYWLEQYSLIFQELEHQIYGEL